MKLGIGIVLGCILMVNTVQAATQTSANSVLVPLVVQKIQPPTIDGHVNAAEWGKAGVIKSFAENSKGGPPKAATKAFVGYDEKNLYIAIINSEPQMNKAVQNTFVGRDREIYTNECNEIMLNPSADKTSYFHFISDILGQKFDALGSDTYGYNPDWKTAAYKGDKFWSAEIAIPFTSINTKTPKAGDLWYALIARERKAVNELSASKATLGSFDAVGQYGTWIFGSLKMNLQKQVNILQDSAKSWPKEISSDSTIWRKNLKAFQTRLSTLSETATQSNYPKLSSDIEALQKEAKPLELKAIHFSAGGKSVLVTKAYPYQPFIGGQIIRGEQAGSVNLTLLQNEWADVAFNLTNLSDNLITLRCSVRQGNADGDFTTLGLRGLDVKWQQALGVAAGDGEKVYDAISPITSGAIEIPAGITSQVWLSVHAPINANEVIEGQIVIQAVDGSALDPIRLPIKVTTIPVQLTAKKHIDVFTWDGLAFPPGKYPELAKAYYTDLKEHGVNIARISSVMHLPRVKANADGSITEPFDFTKVDNILSATDGIFDKYYISMDIWAQESLYTDQFGLDFYSPAYEKAFKTWWAKVLDHLKSRGLTDKNIIANPVDECSDQRFVTIAHWIKDVDPKIQTVIDNHGGDILKGNRNPTYMADIWMPHYTQYFDAVYKQNVEIVKQTKTPLWVYYYSESGNEKKMNPTSRYLSKFWWAFSENITGMGYWAQQLYGDPWYRKASPNTYDTSLSYPTETGVIPSRRWQAWRQGWQDYCLLAIVKEKLQKTNDTAKLAELNQKVEDTINNGIDPIKTDAVRLWLKNELSTTP